MSNSSNSGNSRQQSSHNRQRYQIIRQIGYNRVGGRITYLATDTATGETVVIKQFQFAQSGSDWSGFKTYDREIKIIQNLSYPSIPRYLDSFETSKGFCMVQEYKNGSSLAVPRSFAPDDIERIAISILDILIYLQSQTPPIIHRDIKPENILVDEQTNVYLLDFGFAQISGTQGMTSTVAAGTFGFMAPEQIYNRPLNNATDLYGLGATLICLVTGTKSTDIGKLIDEDNRLNFKHLVSQLSPQFLDWLEKLVQPSQKDRYPSAAAAKKVLQSINVSAIAQSPQSDADQKQQQTKIVPLSKSVPVAPINTSEAKKNERNSWMSFFKNLLMSKFKSKPQIFLPTEEEITLVLTRRGTPNWTEEDFQQLLYTLRCAGYGWLEPEAVRQQLELSRGIANNSKKSFSLTSTSNI